MKNFIVTSVLGRTTNKHRPPGQYSYGSGSSGRDQSPSKVPLAQRVCPPLHVLVQDSRKPSHGDYGPQSRPRPPVHSAAKERIRGRSCDRNPSSRSKNDLSDDGGFTQWQEQRRMASPSSKSRNSYNKADEDLHYAKPVSIAERINNVVLRERGRHQLQQADSHLGNGCVDRQSRSTLASGTRHHSLYMEESTSHSTSLAYSSGEDGPQSLDSHMHLLPPVRASSQDVDHMTCGLSRKLSMYGTLPRNRVFNYRIGQPQPVGIIQDASVSETAHLQQRLRGLSSNGNNGNSNGPHPTDLTTLRGRLVGQPQPVGSTGTTSTGSAASAAAACNGDRDSSIDEVSSSGPTSAAAAPLASSAHSSGSTAAAAALTGASPSANPSSGNLAHSKADHTATDFGALKSRSCAGSSDPSAVGTLRQVRSFPNVDDLIHLAGPLTEDAVLKTLQARFYAEEFFTNIGPILLALNPYNDVGNPLTLSSTRNIVQKPQLVRVVQEAVRQQSETGYPQAIILSGCSGSGKTYASMLLLRQLFDAAGGGPETDAFKHLAAAFTVLRSLGSAKTQANSESSRIGHFIEVQVTDGALYRTKIHCYFLDQTRVVRPLAQEKNYHIFYQMLAGLTPEERTRLSLEGYSVHNLRYLNRGDTRCNEAEDARRFAAWKACLGVLGIPFLDVVRVLAAVLLLGNLQFHENNGTCETHEAELKAVSGLLGVTPASLLRGLTMRTHNVRGQLVKSMCDANMSNMARDALAKALYCRTVATIVRRANSLKRLCMSGTLSSDSNDSVHNQAEVASQHASTVGTAGSKSSRSMAVLNTAVRHATDGFIGILDMFGFEDPKPSQLEHLCINLCAETMQHFFNTHIFKSSIESCREEGIQCDLQPDYVDNVPCIDLISSLRTGLLSMLDVECTARGTPESYVQKVRLQHKHNSRLLEPKSASDPRLFGIQHFAGKVIYNTSDFIDTNRDVLPDDLVSVFYKQNCQFGFATHLFGSELKALYAHETAPRGIRFRISPTSHTDLLNGDDPVSTLTQDFHTRLDNLLRTLVHAKPHFVRCVRANSTEQAGIFDRSIVTRQIRALQVLETVNLMAGGFPHRMRFKAFNARYKMLAPFKRLKRIDEKAVEDCTLILECFQRNTLELPKHSNVSTSWSLGKRHIFLSEGARQQLETLRADTRHNAAVIIQSTWRGWHWRRRWPTVKRQFELRLGRPLVVASGNNANASSAGVNINRVSGHNSNVGQLSNRNQQQQQQQQQQQAQQQQQQCNGQGSNSQQQQQQQQQSFARPRPQPIACTPPPEALVGLNQEKCDAKTIQHTCSLFGLDLERPPPLPPSRSYTVAGNSKLGYPQTRIMKSTFPEDANGDVVLRAGEAVLVVGASHRRGHLLVEHKNHNFHVPYQYLELKSNQPGVDI